MELSLNACNDNSIFIIIDKSISSLLNTKNMFLFLCGLFCFVVS
jgi:hypothetical protein